MILNTKTQEHHANRGIAEQKKKTYTEHPVVILFQQN